MTEVYFLKNFKPEMTKKLSKSNDESIIFPLDYESLSVLNDNKIAFEYIDDFLTDDERKELFIFCRNIWQHYSSIKNSKVSIHGINVLNCIDRNEIHEYLMETYSDILMMKTIIEKYNPKKIYAPKGIIAILKAQNFKNDFIEIYEETPDELSFDYVNFRKKISFININFKFSRKHFKILKNILEQFYPLFLSNQKFLKNSKVILLLEFEPSSYEKLLVQIHESGFVPLLANFRRPAISSFSSLKAVKRSKSLILTSKMLRLTEKTNSQPSTMHNILQSLETMDFDDFNYSCIVSDIIKNKILNVLDTRLDEYLKQIYYFIELDKFQNIKSALTLNLSGESEKIFSNIRKNIPMILLQHGFSNYHDFNSYTDTLDDYDLLNDRIAVWGNEIKQYLLTTRKLKNEQIIVTGSPRHENFFDKKFLTNKKIILITLRPLIKHVEGTKLKLLIRYNEILNSVINFLNSMNDVQIIVKLHPQQNVHNQIIKSLLSESKADILVLQTEPIKPLLEKSYLLVNISPDNFDVSTVILESMLAKTPILNIKLQKNSWIYDFEKTGAVLSFDFDSNFKETLIRFIEDDKFYDQQLNKIKEFLDFYLKQNQSPSKKLIDNIKC